MPDNEEFTHVKLPDGCQLMAGNIPLKMALAVAEADPSIIPEIEAQLGGQRCEPIHFQHSLGPYNPVPPGFHPFPQPDPKIRQINAAMNLVTLFSQLRFHVVASKISQDDEKEGWQRTDAGPLLQATKFTDDEQTLYDVCLRRLARYIDEDPPGGG